MVTSHHSGAVPRSWTLSRSLDLVTMRPSPGIGCGAREVGKEPLCVGAVGGNLERLCEVQIYCAARRTGGLEPQAHGWVPVV